MHESVQFRAGWDKVAINGDPTGNCGFSAAFRLTASAAVKGAINGDPVISSTANGNPKI